MRTSGGGGASDMTRALGRSDLANGLAHISHSWSDGWLRKVHAGHAMLLSFRASGPRSLGADADGGTSGGAVAGRDGARERGTPQRAHVAAEGLTPGGLR